MKTKTLTQQQEKKLNKGESMCGEYLRYKWCIVRQPMGHLCGYVKLWKNHPLEIYFKKRCAYDEIDIDCHGGLTFSEKIKKGESKHFTSGYWIGWDYAHAFDEMVIDEPTYHSVIPGKHWTEDEVIKECYDVIEQLTNKYL